MTDQPNLITESGRETLSLDDRIALLAADVAQLRGGPLNPNYTGPAWTADQGESYRAWRTTDQTDYGSKAHAFNSLLGKLSNAVHLHSKAIGVQTDWLSRAECELLAWRRGGFYEWLSVRREAQTRDTPED